MRECHYCQRELTRNSEQIGKFWMRSYMPGLMPKNRATCSRCYRKQMALAARGFVAIATACALTLLLVNGQWALGLTSVALGVGMWWLFGKVLPKP